MTQTAGRLDLERALPVLDGELQVEGLRETLTIRRDEFGVAHVRAANEHDAWLGMGFAAAQDRLWQMEYDRRRAVGRWSEAAGPTGVAADVQARRLQLGPAARADVEVMSAGTRAVFEAYAAGVNTFLRSGQPLPVEYDLAGIAPEPWEPWHSAALFKVRHVLMGVWQQKVARAKLLALIGPEAFGRLDGRAPAGSALVLPPSANVSRLFDRAAADVAAAAAQLGFMSEVEGGSNSWAVHGSRTTTGMPVLCNDSHRALDVPSVYWQAHVSCPAFDVIGATFPGLPGFPHFGTNGAVAWNITHAHADYQDLYIEEFDPAEPERYRVPGGWASAERSVETIAVRGGEAVQVECWRTRHGPLVHGDPRDGHALALRYTATDGPQRGFEPLRPMLTARSVAELHESQREWVDPVNNLVSADTAGHIGYLTRGALPVRTSEVHRQLPAPGWTGEHEWTGIVPFARLPRAIDPEEGIIVTANQRIVEGDDPFISHFFAVPSRAERIRELLSEKERFTPDEIAAIQGDTTSRPARAWVRLLGRCGPFPPGEAERARALLAGWDGDLLPDSAAALLYACFRRALVRPLFEPVTGAAAWRWLSSPAMPATQRLIGGWLAEIVWKLDGECALSAPDGRPWDVLLPPVLEEAWRDTVRRAGADPSTWRWADYHPTRARHTLADAFPGHAERLNPRSVRVGGDGDTIQVSSCSLSGAGEFVVSGVSVYRQVVDMADVASVSYVVPGGASGHPGSEHYGDQLEPWRTHRRIPARYTERDVAAGTRHTLTLRPA